MSDAPTKKFSLFGKIENRETALLWLADMSATGGPRVEMLRELVRFGADLNMRSFDGANALTLARDAGSEGGDELVAELLALGAKDEL